MASDGLYVPSMLMQHAQDGANASSTPGSGGEPHALPASFSHRPASFLPPPQPPSPPLALQGGDAAAAAAAGSNAGVAVGSVDGPAGPRPPSAGASSSSSSEEPLGPGQGDSQQGQGQAGTSGGEGALAAAGDGVGASDPVAAAGIMVGTAPASASASADDPVVVAEQDPELCAASARIKAELEAEAAELDGDVDVPFTTTTSTSTTFNATTNSTTAVSVDGSSGSKAEAATADGSGRGGAVSGAPPPSSPPSALQAAPGGAVGPPPTAATAAEPPQQQMMVLPPAPPQQQQQQQPSTSASSSALWQWFQGKGKQELRPLLPVPVNPKRSGEATLALTIAINGWVKEPDDFVAPWQPLPELGRERWALVWESEVLTALGGALGKFIRDKAIEESSKMAVRIGLGTALVAAMAVPMAVLSAINLTIGSKWRVALRRAQAAGRCLAHLLMRGAHGDRPVTLIGFSIGARLIFHCLLELSRCGARGIVESAVLLGAPVSGSVSAPRWAAVRSVVSGRFVNAYSANDWVLGIVFRAHSKNSMISCCAGLEAVAVPGVENVNLSALIDGHMQYLEQLDDVLSAINLAET